MRVPEPRLGALRRACGAGRGTAGWVPPAETPPPPRGGGDVSLEDLFEGRAGQVGRSSAQEPGETHTGVGPRAEMWEVCPECTWGL